MVLLVIVARLVDVQVVHSSQYRAEGSQELARVIALPALRGGIYDRQGQVLAVSIPTKMVVADDFQVAQPKAEASELAPLVGMSAPTLARKLRERSGYVPLARTVSESTGAAIAGKDFPGITLLDSSKRVMPNGQLASSWLGSLNAAGAGSGGIEYQYNRLLGGRSGRETLLEAPSGMPLPTAPLDKSPSRPGTGLELTVDEPLQYETEQALAAEIESSKALSGTAVVMDVRTGQVLSMANLVAKDPGTGTPPSSGVIPIGKSGPVAEASSNLALTQSFEPGSVFKLVTFSGALQDGLITPSSTFTVPDQISIDGVPFHDAEAHPTEHLSAAQVLAQSSNIGTSEIAFRLGERRLLQQVRHLGFGEPTGLHFPGEQSGLLATAKSWSVTDRVDVPIGQVDSVTAMQVLDAYNAVANGGVLVQPRLVRGTVASDGSVSPTAPSRSRRVFSESTSVKLTGMLEQVVASGTGTSAVVPGYTVAGKTGTAEIPGPGGYLPGAYMATFVGFAPASHPTLSAIVVLNRPTPIYGGSVAAPVFAQIMSYALHRYDIPTTPGASTQQPSPSSSDATSQQQDVT